MPDQLIRYVFPSLAGASSSLTACQASIGERLSELHARLAPLREDWDSDARRAYDECQTQWNTAAGEIERLLGELGTAVTQSNDNMSSTEVSCTNLFR